MNSNQLLIHQIHLINWRCYQNEKIVFQTDLDKNVYVIFGKNGYGKTSILTAITWCLYGSEVIKDRDLIEKEYFNRIALQSDQELELAVQLKLFKNNHIYQIDRTAKRKVKGSSVFAEVSEPKVIDLQEKLQDYQKDGRERIEDLLPRSCRDFFFFDGVEIKEYAKQHQTQDTRDAIERVLGIPELKNLKEDTEKVIQTLKSNLSQATKNNAKIKQKEAYINDINKEIENKNEKLNSLKEENINAQQVLDSLKEEAKQNEKINQKMQQIDNLEKDIIKIEDHIKNKEQNIKEIFQKSPIALIKGFIYKNPQLFDQKNEDNNQKRYSISTTQLSELLNSDFCWCGRCIDEFAKKNILSQIEYIQQKSSIKSEEEKQQEQFQQHIINLSKYNFPSLDKIILDRDDLEDNLSEIKQTKARLREEVKGYCHKNINIWDQVEEQGQKIGEQQNQIKQLTQQINDLKNKENNLQKEIQELANPDETAKNISDQLQVANKLSQAVEELINWRIEERRETIENETTKIYREVTNKKDEYKGVQISKKYTISIETFLNRNINPETFSAGEKQVLAFALITGLNLASGVAAPLVMDTPCGHLDFGHRQNIINSLPKLPSQVILLATDRDLPSSILEQLKPYIAQTHIIERADGQEDISTIEPE